LPGAVIHLLADQGWLRSAGEPGTDDLPSSSQPSAVRSSPKFAGGYPEAAAGFLSGANAEPAAGAPGHTILTVGHFVAERPQTR